MRCRASRFRPTLGPVAPVLQAKRDSRRAPQSSPGVSLANVPAHSAASGTAAGTRLPERLKAGVESLSGIAMDDVRVHRNSSGPARIGALAYAQGRDIHLGPGQDRHLPHEAWHVAQQKQGRVKADGGLALNAEPALEAEADRMGDAAARADPAGETGTPRPASAAPGVIQPKVIAGDTWLKPTDTVSPTLLTFIENKARYRLRDDFQTDLTAEPVHLLDMSKKYLLGETHGDAATAKWEDSVKFWSKVGKMFESTKALPASERREVGMPAADPQNQPLESRHAYTLADVLELHDQLNVLGASWVRSLWTDPAHKDFVRSMVTGAQDTLRAIDFAKHEYGEFLTAYDSKRKHSERSSQVRTFAAEFRDSYQPAIATLQGFLQSAAEAMDAYDPAGADPDSVKAKFEKALDDIAANRAFLVSMAGTLIGLTGASDENEVEALEKILAPNDAPQGVEVLNAVDPARERAMAQNIIAAEAPLLVKLGEFHVDDVERMVGPSAVAVHETETLEDKTRQPPGP